MQDPEILLLLVGHNKSSPYAPMELVSHVPVLFASNSLTISAVVNEPR